jgi:hypothetical protein
VDRPSTNPSVLNPPIISDNCAMSSWGCTSVSAERRKRPDGVRLAPHAPDLAPYLPRPLRALGTARAVDAEA